MLEVIETLTGIAGTLIDAFSIPLLGEMLLLIAIAGMLVRKTR